jgi:hypothetical protein
VGRSLARDTAVQAVVTAGATTGAWLFARGTGTQERASMVALVTLVGTQLGQTLVAGWCSPLVVGASVVSAAALGAIVSTPGSASSSAAARSGRSPGPPVCGPAEFGIAGGLAAFRVAERVWPDWDRPEGGEPVAQEPLDEPEPSIVDSKSSRTRRGEEQP